MQIQMRTTQATLHSSGITRCVGSALGTGLLLVMLTGCASLREPAGTGQAGGASSPLQTKPVPKKTQSSSSPAVAETQPRAVTNRIKSSPDSASAPQELTDPLLFQLLLGEVALQRGQPGAALSAYMGLAKQTRDPRIARRATELALATRNVQAALEASTIWMQAAPTSVEALHTAETLMAVLGKTEDLISMLTLRREQARSKNQLDLFYADAAKPLSRMKNRDDAMKAAARLAEPDRQLAPARLMMAEVAATVGDIETAFVEAQVAADLDPEWEQPALFIAKVHSSDPIYAREVIPMLEKALEINPDSVDLRVAYGKQLVSNKKLLEARQQFEKALEKAPQHPGVLLALGLLSHQSSEDIKAREYLTRYLGVKGEQNPSVALLYLAQIAEDNKKYEEAISWLEQIPMGEQFHPARIRMAVLLAKDGKAEKGLEELNTIPSHTQAEKIQVIVAKAQIHKLMQRFQDAFYVLDQALSQHPNDPDLLYDHAMAAERLESWDVLEKSLRRVIELKPDHPHAYNALGYTLADRNIRLDEAHSLVAKAMALQPNDPYILDSMGWVEFRRGNLVESKQLIDSAFKIKPDPEVGAHLGEVLWNLGQTAESKSLLLALATQHPDNEVLKKTLKRLGIR